MKNIILSSKDLDRICRKIAKDLDKELKNEKNIPVVVGVMKGSLNFMMDLTKYMKTDLYTDFIQISSYSGTETTGKVVMKKDLSFNIENRTVILIEDIIDTGISMHFLIKFLKDHYHPKRILLVTLLDKVCRRKVKVHIDYAGMVMKNDAFVLGYGLDYNEYGRNLPYVCALTKQEIKMIDQKTSQKITSYASTIKNPRRK
ncbi:MAG: hypoxanthine phosphoribosyltransferase [Bacilli bacterium]|nr:hypoxanthine phosphoribosyltransferase [Bacilli bacterium]